MLENYSIVKIFDVNRFSDASKIFRVIAFFKIYKQREEKNKRKINHLEITRYNY